MYKENPQFEPPADAKSKIWRYMKFQKFRAMAESDSLYFCTWKKLRTVDPYEGSCLGWELLSSVLPEVAQEFVRQMQSSGPPVTINCWHLSEFESMAMWRLYGDEVGIAVQSTFDRLIRSLAKCPCEVKIGKVKYFMPGKESFNSADPFTIFVPYLHKHRGFEYEHELRAIVWETGDMPRQPDGDIPVGVDLKTLIEAIYVSPRASSGVRKDVEEVMRTHGLDAPVLQSELMTLPPY
jgi:hypothetical protein